MRAIATAFSCLALMSCSTESEIPRSPLLGEVVRAPDVVWSRDTFDCGQISSEDNRLAALSRANETERHRLTRARNIQLVQWVIPYYGWVATARAGMLDEEIKRVDLMIEDAGDRRTELNQFAVAKGCAATAAIADAAVLVPAMMVPAPPPRRVEAQPVVQRDASVRRPAQPIDETPPKAPPARAPAVRPPVVFAQTAVASQASKAESGIRIEGKNMFLTLGPGADLDQITADLKSALQQH
jgi:hypothetical protein